jgi:DNA-binding beta-propeller fold protein YncE
VRVIEGQATKLGRTMHGIDYNPVRDEIVVGNPMAAAVLVFRGGAKGDAAPIRVIQGSNTKLVFPHSAVWDTQNNEIIVGDPGGRRVLVFAGDANGNVAPLRMIEGPQSKLNYVVGLAVDPMRNLLVVSSGAHTNGVTGLFIFNRTANGDVEPRAVIAGPKTGFLHTWQLQVDSEAGKIFVADVYHESFYAYKVDKLRPNIGEIREIPSPWSSKLLGFIGVWNITDHGDVPPSAMIKGPLSGLIHPGGLALNIKDKEIIVAESVRNGVFIFSAPQFFQTFDDKNQESGGARQIR